MVSIGKTTGIATIEWNASPLNDVVADAIVALLMHTQSSASSIRASSQPCGHSQRRRRKRGGLLKENQVVEDDRLDAYDNTHENASEDDRDMEGKRLKKQRNSLLRLCHQALMESYAHVEAIFESSIATFEIRMEGQITSGIHLSSPNLKPSGENPSSDESSLVCTVTVSFEAENSLDAKISVECVDAKLANAIQECLRNVALASVPISFPG